MLTQTNYDKKDVETYETLQDAYRKLFSEYEKIKSDDSQSPLLDEMVKKLSSKQKEIQECFAKFA